MPKYVGMTIVYHYKRVIIIPYFMMFLPVSAGYFHGNTGAIFTLKVGYNIR